MCVWGGGGGDSKHSAACLAGSAKSLPWLVTSSPVPAPRPVLLLRKTDSYRGVFAAVA